MRWLLPLFLVLPVPAPAAETVTVYAYDSFAGKGSLGAWLSAALEKKTGIKTKVVSFGSAGEALNQVAVEGAATKADVVVGIDDSLLARARELDAFDSLAAEAGPIAPELRFDAELKVLPFDYGYLSVVYDRRRVEPPAGLSLRDFARDPRFRKKLAIEDPRTSSLGRSLLLWTRCLAEGAEWAALWTDLAKQTMAVAPGWSAAYGLFLKKQADFVVSYTTSPAYHLIEEKSDAYRAMAFPEGHYRQVEGVALSKRSPRKEAARKWIAFLLGDEAQKQLPRLQWMYPAAKGTPLPPEFDRLVKVSKTLQIDPTLAGKSQREWLREWTRLAAQAE